jgi:hypothetical protein
MKSNEGGWNPRCCISFQFSGESTRHAAAVMSAMTGTENGKDATDDRFRILHLLFKLGATPLIPTASRLYNICRVLFMLCSYLTPPMMIVGAMQNLDDIAYVMEVARPLITISSIMWMNSFIRYLSYNCQAFALQCSTEFSSNNTDNIRVKVTLTRVRVTAIVVK